MVGTPCLPRVLIVDDQPNMARALARAFIGEAEVSVALSAIDALARIEQGERFELVICDVMMPGMTGTQLYERVRAFDSRTANAFVFATGGLLPEEQERVDATGVRCFIKPLGL